MGADAPLTYGSSDTEPDTSCEGSETLLPQARNRGKTKNMSTRYSTNYVAMTFKDAYVPGDFETSVTKQEGETFHNRVSPLQDIYTTSRMLVSCLNPERVSRSHCLTGFRISRKQGNHEPVERLDELIGRYTLSPRLPHSGQNKELFPTKTWEQNQKCSATHRFLFRVGGKRC